MSGIRGRDTHPELLIRSLLHRTGFRFRLNVPDMPGRPDIVLPRYRAAILVHGCFWHGHGCRYFKWPATRPEFWRTKIVRNQQNDTRAISALRSQGWRVCIVWECGTRSSPAAVEKIVGKLGKWIRGSRTMLELKE